jgi:hypothetical protein
LKQTFLTNRCSFPPSMSYKENWLYKTSYNSNISKRICVWTHMFW